MTDQLTPPDPKQCQAEKPNGATFMSMGGVPKRVRCTNKPTMLLTETTPDEHNRVGSMTVCDECFAIFQKQTPPGAATARRL